MANSPRTTSFAPPQDLGRMTLNEALPVPVGSPTSSPV